MKRWASICVYVRTVPDEGLRDRECGRCGVLSYLWPDLFRGQCVQSRPRNTAVGTDHPAKCPGHKEPVRAAVWQREHLIQHAGTWTLRAAVQRHHNDSKAPEQSGHLNGEMNEYINIQYCDSMTTSKANKVKAKIFFINLSPLIYYILVFCLFINLFILFFFFFFFFLYLFINIFIHLYYCICFYLFSYYYSYYTMTVHTDHTD